MYLSIVLFTYEYCIVNKPWLVSYCDNLNHSF